MATEAIEPAAVVALGMVTPLGHGADASCAAIRAGLTRFTELPGIEVEGKPVVGAFVRGVTDGHLGLGRFARLAGGAMKDLIGNAGGGLTPVPGLYLALPQEDRPALDGRIAKDLPARIGEWSELGGLAARARVFPS